SRRSTSRWPSYRLRCWTPIFRDPMTNTTRPSVFEAGLPTLDYDVTDPPQGIYPQFQAAQQAAPVALGPIGPEVLSYELARTVLRDPRFVVPAGIHLSAHGITSG